MYNILVCDDEKDIVSALKIYLTGDGYRIYEAFNGKEALACIRQQDIHLVLMDIMMPEMDGIEAMVEIRKISNVPVILLTAKSEDTDKILGLTVGADDYKSSSLFFHRRQDFFIQKQQAGFIQLTIFKSWDRPFMAKRNKKIIPSPWMTQASGITNQVRATSGWIPEIMKTGRGLFWEVGTVRL